MSSKSLPVAILALAALIAPMSIVQAADKLYRWIDRDGHVHYGDQPAAGAEAFNPKIPLATTAPLTAAVPDKATQDAEECQRKKDQLVTYRNSARIQETDSLGNTREFSTDDKQKLIQVTEQAIRDHCGSG